MIVVQDFQDAYTLNVRQLMKCCVEQITPDGRLIPFCAYNSVGYREQVREQLSGTPVATVVPNALELADLVVPTRHGSRTVGDAAAVARTASGSGEPGSVAAMTASQATTSLLSLARMANDLRGVDGEDAAAVKSCCATVYGFDLVALFLGESYHPGGVTLTRRLAERLDLQHGERVLDVACGIGTTALLLAAEREVDVDGIDLGATQIAHARARAAAAGLGDRARFEVGDAERLPVDDGQFDAVVCECALCTFPDKAAAAAEMARVLRPGGRVGITDIWLDPTRLDPELRGLAGRVACVADARPIADVVALVEAAGFGVTQRRTSRRGAARHDRAHCRPPASPAPRRSPCAPRVQHSWRHRDGQACRRARRAGPRWLHAPHRRQTLTHEPTRCVAVDRHCSMRPWPRPATIPSARAPRPCRLITVLVAAAIAAVLSRVRLRRRR